PLLVRVIACAVLVVLVICDAKVSDAGARPTVGAGATPVPLSGTDCGLPVPVSVMLDGTGGAQGGVGEKGAVRAHLQQARRGPGGHVVVLGKSRAVVPVTAMLLVVSGPGPLLVRVIACAALVVLVVCDAKVSDAGARPTVGAGATPVPLSATDCGLPVPVSVM